LAIYGGEEVASTELPFMAFLDIKYPASGDFRPTTYCGGVLIDDSTVLTLGYCLLNIEFVTVTLGEYFSIFNNSIFNHWFVPLFS